MMTTDLTVKESELKNRSEMELPCRGNKDCENCVYYGRSSDAPDTVEKDCLYFQEFDSDYSE